MHRMRRASVFVRALSQAEVDQHVSELKGFKQQRTKDCERY
jgi:hypothetical protein